MMLQTVQEVAAENDHEAETSPASELKKVDSLLEGDKSEEDKQDAVVSYADLTAMKKRKKEENKKGKPKGKPKGKAAKTNKKVKGSKQGKKGKKGKQVKQGKTDKPEGEEKDAEANEAKKASKPKATAKAAGSRSKKTESKEDEVSVDSKKAEEEPIEINAELTNLANKDKAASPKTVEGKKSIGSKQPNSPGNKSSEDGEQVGPEESVKKSAAEPGQVDAEEELEKTIAKSSKSTAAKGKRKEKQMDESKKKKGKTTQEETTKVEQIIMPHEIHNEDSGSSSSIQNSKESPPKIKRHRNQRADDQTAIGDFERRLAVDRDLCKAAQTPKSQRCSISAYYTRFTTGLKFKKEQTTKVQFLELTKGLMSEQIEACAAIDLFLQGFEHFSMTYCLICFAAQLKHLQSTISMGKNTLLRNGNIFSFMFQLPSKAHYLDEHPDLKGDTPEFTCKIDAFKQAYNNGALALTALDAY